jgi:DNA-binding CsgD family transcriptional regulator
MQQGLETSSHLQDRRLLVLESKFVVWWLAGEQGDPEQLAMLLGGAEAMGDAIGSMPAGWRKTGTPEALAALQVRLGKEQWEAALQNGRAMSFSQISELLSKLLNGVGSGGSSGEESSGKRRRHLLLSPREEEVLRFVAEGLTNKEIARQLRVSENTVKTHVTSLFNRLGVDSRARAVAVAANEGLLERLSS